MTKAEFIDKVHEAAGEGLSKKATGEMVEAVFETLAEAVREGRFNYPSFGTFTVKERAAREGRNPRTGKPIKIAASKTVGFKPAPKFKESL